MATLSTATECTGRTHSEAQLIGVCKYSKRYTAAKRLQSYDLFSGLFACRRWHRIRPDQGLIFPRSKLCSSLLRYKCEPNARTSMESIQSQESPIQWISRPATSTEYELPARGRPQQRRGRVVNQELPAGLLSNMDGMNVESVTSEAPTMSRMPSDQLSLVSSRSGKSKKVYHCPQCSEILKCNSEFKCVGNIIAR